MAQLTQPEMKQHLGTFAAEQVVAHARQFYDQSLEKKLCVGLGTGSTVDYFMKALAQKCKEGLKISGVPSSLATEHRARELGIPLCSSRNLLSVDLTIDGADAVAPSNQLIKGGGGALFREKLLATYSKKVIILIDETKLVENLTETLIPIELLPFFAEATFQEMLEAGYTPTLRKNKESTTLFLTDNGNFIADLRLPSKGSLAEHEARLERIPGVLCVGTFLSLASCLYIAKKEGSIEQRELPQAQL